MSSVHAVHLVGLTCISTCKILLNTISKISDIVNSSLKSPLILYASFAPVPHWFALWALKLVLLEHHCAAYPDRVSVLLNISVWCIFSVRINCIRFSHQHSDRLNQQPGWLWLFWFPVSLVPFKPWKWWHGNVRLLSVLRTFFLCSLSVKI